MQGKKLQKKRYYTVAERKAYQAKIQRVKDKGLAQRKRLQEEKTRVKKKTRKDYVDRKVVGGERVPYNPATSVGTSNANKQVLMSNADPDIAFTVAVQAQIFYAFAMGVTSWALQRGWAGGSDNVNNPYLAFAYVANMLQSAAVNSIPTSLTVPKFFSWVLQSVTQKTVKHAGGNVSFKFFFSSATPGYQQFFGPGNSSCWQMSVPNQTVLIDGDWYEANAPIGYTDLTGAAAWTSLLDFITAATGLPHDNLTLVSASEPNMMTKDVSAFAVLTPNPGGGAFGVGGPGSQQFSEVGVRRPVFGCFYANALGETDLNRYPKYMNSFGGDGVFLASIMFAKGEQELKSKKGPIFKFFDINEVIEVYALVLMKAIYQRWTDPTTITATNVPGVNTQLLDLVSASTCPLTLQEFSIVIRQLILNILKDSQPFVQGLYPRTVDSTGDNVFTPCVVGANCCALSCANSMMIPDALIENIKAFTYCKAYAKKGKKQHVRPVYPVAGIYSLDALDPDDYTVTVELGNPSQSFTIPVFQPATSTTISLIDGKSNTSYACINDPARLNELITLFNNWINTLSPFISALGAASTDAGIPVLTNMNVTSYWVPPVDPSLYTKSNTDDYRKKMAEHREQVAMRREYYKELEHYNKGEVKKGKKPLPRFERTWVEKRTGISDMKHLSTSPYAEKVLIDVSYYSPPLQTVWEQIQQFWILPGINAVSGATAQNGNQTLRMASWQEEDNQIILASTSNVLTLAAQHDKFASTMVKARNEEKKLFSAILAENNINGRGNIFTDIADGIGSAIGVVSSAGKVLNTVMPMISYV